jgi:hypothetical protein
MEVVERVDMGAGIATLRAFFHGVEKVAQKSCPFL